MTSLHGPGTNGSQPHNGPANLDPARWVTLAIVLLVGVHRGARQHGAQRRDPHDPARVPHHAACARMGGHRVRAHVRDAADHRRSTRRHLRPSAGVHRRGGALRRRFVDRVGLDLGPAARDRRGDHRGHRRLADAAGDARPALGHVPRTRARDRLRRVGRERRRCCRLRPGRRRLSHDELLVALVVPDQRDHRSARDHRRASCSCATR